MFTVDKPFLNPRIFADGNFLASTGFVGLIGIVLFATLALLPPLLQNELKYPVVLTGLIIAPRGIGTVLGMMVVGPLVSRIDIRAIMAGGLLLMAYSLWSMSKFSPDMSYSPIIVSGFIQGLGVALVYVPASTAALSTLDQGLRNEGAAMFNLMRNIGSSAGIAAVFALLARNSQVVHASLVELVRLPGSGALGSAIAGAGPLTPEKAAAWNDVISHQSAFIAYLDAFRLMTMLTLATLPFLLILRGRLPGGQGASAAME
jgi:DHA2 family multidrug resistance protein